MAVGPAARTAGMAGVGVVARRVHDGASSAVGQVVRVADREKRDAGEDRPSVGSWP